MNLDSTKCLFCPALLLRNSNVSHTKFFHPKKYEEFYSLEEDYKDDYKRIEHLMDRSIRFQEGLSNEDISPSESIELTTLAEKLSTLEKKHYNL